MDKKETKDKGWNIEYDPKGRPVKVQFDKEYIKEVKAILDAEVQQVDEEKKLIYDKSSGQFSLKIPKNLALKAGLNENSVMKLVFRPALYSSNEIQDSKFVIYLKEEKDEKRKKQT